MKRTARIPAGSQNEQLPETRQQCEAGPIPETPPKPRTAALKNIYDAWHARERARARVLGTWSLEGIKELEGATAYYAEKRVELQQASPKRQLTQEHARNYPTISKTDLTAPKVRPSRAKGWPDMSISPTRVGISIPDLDSKIVELHRAACKAEAEYWNAETELRNNEKPKDPRKIVEWQKHKRDRLKQAAQKYRAPATATRGLTENWRCDRSDEHDGSTACYDAGLVRLQKRACRVTLFMRVR